MPQPGHKIRDGVLAVVIWRNQSELGTHYTVNPSDGGVLVEHWDVIQDASTQEQSESGRPMFGDSFPVHRLRFGSSITRRRLTRW